MAIIKFHSVNHPNYTFYKYFKYFSQNYILFTSITSNNRIAPLYYSFSTPTEGKKEVTMGTVRHILQKKGHDVLSINPNATVYQALEQMVVHDVGALLVVNEGRFVGIFTERDYARKVILKGKASRQTLVREIMSEHPATITPDDTVEDCMKLMTQKYIRHLPVMEGHKLVGLVSIGDIVKYIIEEQKFIIDNLEHYITGS